MKFCPHCGKEIQQGIKFCGSCGKPITESLPLTESTNVSINPNVKPCPACGKDVGVTASKCPHCGTSLKQSFGKQLIEFVKSRLFWSIAVFFGFYKYFYYYFPYDVGDWKSGGVQGAGYITSIIVCVLGYAISVLLIPNVSNILKLTEKRRGNLLVFAGLTFLFIGQLMLISINANDQSLYYVETKKKIDSYISNHFMVIDGNTYGFCKKLDVLGDLAIYKMEGLPEIRISGRNNFTWTEWLNNEIPNGSAELVFQDLIKTALILARGEVTHGSWEVFILNGYKFKHLSYDLVHKNNSWELAPNVWSDFDEIKYNQTSIEYFLKGIK